MCTRACMCVSTCLTAQLPVGVCLQHMLCWELQARVWEPVCAPLCAHISVSPQRPCWVTVTGEWTGSGACNSVPDRPCNLVQGAHYLSDSGGR